MTVNDAENSTSLSSIKMLSQLSLNKFSTLFFKKVKVAQSCLTLHDPVDYTVHGILQARILEWVAFPFSRGIFPTQGFFFFILYFILFLHSVTSFLFTIIIFNISLMEKDLIYSLLMISKSSSYLLPLNQSNHLELFCTSLTLELIS